MAQELFRKKSLDKIKSPDSLNDYIRITNPGVWILLVAIIVLLIGTCIWGIFGNIETTVSAPGEVQQGILTCTVTPEQIIKIQTGMTVRLESDDDAEGIVQSINTGNNTVTATLNVEDGYYDAQIVIESIKALKFVTN